MKKLIAMFLALCLCMGAALAEDLGSWLNGFWGSVTGSVDAAGREESEFDRLFDSGKAPVLEREYIDVSQVPVYVSAEFARDNAEAFGIAPDSIADGLVLVASAGDVAGEDAKYFFPLSISPDGSKMCAVYEGVALCYDGEKLIVLSVSSEHSVRRGETGDDDDLIGLLKSGVNVYRTLFGSTDGVLWSPDGSKAVFLSSSSFLYSFQMSFTQLMIADMETGEVCLAHRFGDSPMKDEDFGAVMGACFDENSRYVYYTVYAYPPTLRRHDTETGEDIELQTYLEKMAEFPSRPRLHMLRDGSLLTLYEGRERGDYGLLLLHKGLTGRSCRRYDAGLQPLGRLVSFEMNAQSGLGVALDQEGNAGATIPGFVLIVDTDKNMNGLGKPVLIKTDGSAVRLNQTQLLQLVTDGETGDFDSVMAVSLSPDGEYALVTGRSCMYILRLRTLETRRVELPEGTGFTDFCFDIPLNRRFGRGIEWHTSDRICSSAGMFRLTWK